MTVQWQGPRVFIGHAYRLQAMYFLLMRTIVTMQLYFHTTAPTWESLRLFVRSLVYIIYHLRRIVVKGRHAPLRAKIFDHAHSEFEPHPFCIIDAATETAMNRQASVSGSVFFYRRTSNKYSRAYCVASYIFIKCHWMINSQARWCRYLLVLSGCT